MRLAHLVPLALAAGALATTPEVKPLPRDEAALLERGVGDIIEDIKDGFSCAGCQVASPADPWCMDGATNTRRAS